MSDAWSKFSNHPRVSTCQACGHSHEVASAYGPGRKGPTPGDFSICIECAALSRFDENLATQLVSDEELIASAHPDNVIEIRKTQVAVRLSNQIRQRRN